MSVYAAILVGMLVLLVGVLLLLRKVRPNGKAEDEHTDVGECGTILSGPHVHKDSELPSKTSPGSRRVAPRQVRAKGPGRK